MKNLHLICVNMVLSLFFKSKAISSHKGLYSPTLEHLLSVGPQIKKPFCSPLNSAAHKPAAEINRRQLQWKHGKKSQWRDWQTEKWFLAQEHINVWAHTQPHQSGCLLTQLSSSNNFSGYEVCLTLSEIQLILLIPQESTSMLKTSQIEIPHVAMWWLDWC